MTENETITVDIRKPSLSNSILRLLGELRPGERLTSKEIANLFGRGNAKLKYVEECMGRLCGRWLVNKELAPAKRRNGLTPSQYWLADNVVLIDVTDLLEENET